jgi:ribosomal protein S18 acetylase RimI-like enzyme
MTQNDFQIRLANDSDISEVVEIWKHFMDFHRDLDPYHQRSVDGGEHVAAFFRASLASADARLWVGEHRQIVVGYCLARLGQRPPVFHERSYGELIDLAVEEPFRRRGIGTALVREAHRWFAERETKRVELRVSAYNATGLAFWRKLGFQSFGHAMYRDERP